MDGTTLLIVLNKSKTLAPIVCDTLAVHSLPVNFKFGKTGFVFHLRGRGKRKVVFSFDPDNRRFISLVTQSVGNVSCFVYSDYKHVLILVHTHKKLLPEFCLPEWPRKRLAL